MSRYRIEYSGLAAVSRKAMPSDYRARFEKEMARTLGTDPYGHGSDPAGSPQERDRRTATIAGAVVRYYVTNGLDLVVTAVRILHSH
ncbi:hypothetical protein [Streptomyces sp. NPDC001889]